MDSTFLFGITTAKLRDFVFLKTISEGKFSTLSLVESKKERSTRPLVLKQLKMLSSPSIMRRALTNEVSALTVITESVNGQNGQCVFSTHFPKVRFVIDQSSVYGFVMDHLENTVCISDWAQNPELSITSISCIFFQLIKMIAFVHERLVVHCDINNKNVFLF
jgi:serine/threonine protein kinase